MKTSRLMLVLLGCMFLAQFQSARAKVLLKPHGRSAMPLRLKAVQANVEIEKQFATTTTVMTFQNEVAQRIEADFLYSAPPRALVTYFAYWYGEEKVVARVVEKERARQIYQYITSRMRDPALIEMIGKNTFRARIFPIMPNADLKVEMRTVEMLASNKDGAEYSMPLKSEAAGKSKLDNVSVKVRIAPDAMVQGAGNNMALPVSRDADGGWTMQLTQKNYRPTQDLRIGLRMKKPPLRASLFGARSGGGDGFFAVALTPSRAVKKPQLKISGAQLYDVRPRRLPPMKAGRETLVVGRYRAGSAGKTARFSLGGELSADVQLPTVRRDNNLATKLWAAQRIEELSLSTQKSAREQLVALSQRYTLPSKYTSWLAIPEEERQSYKEEKAQADLAYYGALYRKLVLANRARSAEARSARARFNEAAKTLAQDPNNALADVFSQYIQQRAYSRDAKAVKNLRREVNLLARVLPVQQRRDVNGALKNSLQSIYGQALYRAAGNLSDAIAQGRGNSPQARRLWKEMRAAEAKGAAPRNEKLIESLDSAIENYGRKWAQEKHGKQPNATKLAAYNSALSRVVAARKTLDKSPVPTLDAIRREHSTNVLHEHMAQIARALVQQETKYGADAQKMNALRAQASEITRQMPQLTLQEARRSALDWAVMYGVATAYAQEKYAKNPDAAKVAFYKNKADEIIKLHGGEEQYRSVLKRQQSEELARQARLVVNKQTQEWRKAQPSETELLALQNDLDRIQVVATAEGLNAAEMTAYQKSSLLDAVLQRLRDERAKANPDAKLIARLENKAIEMQPFDSHEARPKVKPEVFARWRIERIAVRAQKEKMKEGAERTRLAMREDELKVRMGDPLIAVDAPADAQQVIAILPDGTVKELRYEAAAKRWEARFDVPEYSQNGAHEIVILIVRKDGTRQRLTMGYHVDMQAPTGIGSARDVSTSTQKTWRLEMRAEADTARIAAIMPWGGRIELAQSAGDKMQFFAVVKVPSEYSGKAPRITYILTDKAHNRAQITMDLTP